METIKRSEIKEEAYLLILKNESHHKHEIIEDDQGILRWKENLDVEKIRKNISLNDLCPLLDCMGYGKNKEVYRKLYRNMGYSLNGYWEIFYWDWNNEDTENYTGFKNRLKRFIIKIFN